MVLISLRPPKLRLLESLSCIEICRINPLEKNGEITLDFEGVESATQSFVHALISELIRSFGSEILDNICFKNCNKSVQEIINIVVDYMQAAI